MREVERLRRAPIPALRAAVDRFERALVDDDVCEAMAAHDDLADAATHALANLGSHRSLVDA